MPDLRPSELVEIVRAIRAGGPVPEIPMVQPPLPAHRRCRITCIVIGDDHAGHWCDRCPLVA